MARQVKPTFYEFMEKYVEDNTPVGDLARDMRDDPGFPQLSSSKSVIKAYLSSANACDGAIEALDDAWALYDGTKTAEATVGTTVEVAPFFEWRRIASPGMDRVEEWYASRNPFEATIWRFENPGEGFNKDVPMNMWCVEALLTIGETNEAETFYGYTAKEALDEAYEWVMVTISTKIQWWLISILSTGTNPPAVWPDIKEFD